jgi:hypothetical protein
MSLWCARWFWPSTARILSPAELRALIDSILRGDRTLSLEHLRRRLDETSTVATNQRLFHWPLEFPDVFESTGSGSAGGFDVVIGNPPWEMLRREEGGTDTTHRRDVVRFIRESGLYPSCDRGHVNLYQPFLERSLRLARRGGRIGLVLPWGLATDDGAAPLRKQLLDTTAVDTLVGFDNSRGLFPIHRGLRFMVVASTRGGQTERLRGHFGVTTAEALDRLPDRDDPLDRSAAQSVVITRGQLHRIGGSAVRWPDLRRASDLGFLEHMYSTFPAVGSHESWKARFGRELNATEARSRFTSEGLPVLEGKHIRRFHTAGASQHRISRREALRLLRDGRFNLPRLGYRDVSGVANSRSLIASVIPAGVLTTHTVLCLRTNIADEPRHFLCGVFNSFVLNAVVRLLMGGHLTTGLVEGLPVPAWTASPRQRSIALLAETIAQRGDEPETCASLEAQVARLYDLDEGMFAAVVDGFPLVPVDERKAALAAFGRLGRAGARRSVKN